MERTRIGEVNVTEAMFKSGAVVGGESNGGVIIPRIHPCRDSFAAMAVVLELMAATGRTVTELRADIPAYAVVRDKVAVRADRGPEILRRIRRTYADRRLNFLDGVYIDGGDSWVHVRRSNTEPVMRITAEARTAAEARRLAAELRACIEADLPA